MTQEEKKTTKPQWTNARAWWLLQVGVVSVVLVMASLVLSKHPVAAQSSASDQYEATEPEVSAPTSPTPSERHSAPPSAAPNVPDARSDSEPIVPSILPHLFSQEGEPGTANTTAPSVPEAAVEGLLSGLNELHGALNDLLGAMTGLTFAPEQPAEPGAETNTTASPGDTQNESGGGEASNPAQEAPRPNAPGSEVTEEPSANSPAPPSDPNGGQVPPGNSPSPGDPNAPWPESGCADPSVLTPEQALECEKQRLYRRYFGPYEAPMNPWGPTYEPKYGPKWNP